MQLMNGMFPYQLRRLEAEQNRRVIADFAGLPHGLQSVLSWGFKLSGTATIQDLVGFYRRKPVSDDIWLFSPPKCGSMWTQEMVWLLYHNLDYDSCERMLTERWTFRESCLSQDQSVRARLIQGRSDSASSSPKKDINSNIAAQPQFIKSHMPFSLCPPELVDTCKTVYVARNPKDLCVSFYNHARRYKFLDFQRDFDAFAEHFLNGTVVFTPVMPHMIEAWRLRHHPNMCFLFYEDMKSDLRGQVEKVASFLDRSYSDSQLNGLAQYLHIDNFKRNPWRKNDFGKSAGIVKSGEGEFIRKGKTGDWVNYMSDELSERFDRWMEKGLEGTDLRFRTVLSHQD